MATLNYDKNGENVSTKSNDASLRVAEIIDVTIEAVTPRTAIVADAAVTAVPFLVTNAGNGSEAFALAATTDKPAATVKGIAIDTDGNGVYDPAVDTLLNGTTLPALAAHARQHIFVLVANAGAAGGDVGVTASVRATTGSGAAGTVFAGQGEGGGDAIVGKTGAAASAQALLTAGVAPPTLVKSQSVIAPDGSARALRGATVTYTLTAHFNGATPAAVLADRIPDSTLYVPGSLTLDGTRMSDAADTDAGSFDGHAVHVALGDVAAGERTITFQTIIQ